MTQDQIIAFRLHQHHLVKPIDETQLELAAAAGLQNTVPGTVPLALGVRLLNFNLEILDRAMQKKKTLVEITGIRGASYIVPSRDFSIFTTAAYPRSEKDLASFIKGSFKSLKSAKSSATEVVETVAKVTLEILNKKALTQDEIHEQWRRKLTKNFLRWCRGCQSFHVPYSVVMAVGIKGCFCFGPYKDGTTAYVRTDQWLPSRFIKNDMEEARRQLAQRFLHFYGPNTVSGFANWAGLSKNQAQETWSLVEEDLLEIPDTTGTRWLLKKDVKAFGSPPTPPKVVLLPPRDAFLNLPDRETLVPEKKHHPHVWRVLGNPGVLLVNGRVAALWKFQKKKDTLQSQFTALEKIPKALREIAEEKLETLVPLRECKNSEVEWN